MPADAQSQCIAGAKDMCQNPLADAVISIKEPPRVALAADKRPLCICLATDNNLSVGAILLTTRSGESFLNGVVRY